MLFGIGYSGCKTIQPTIEQSDRKSMPPSFAQAKDSTNSANINWRDFFADKNLNLLIDTALKNNYDVLMTVQKIQIAGSDLQLTKGALLPTVIQILLICNANLATTQWTMPVIGPLK